MEEKVLAEDTMKDASPMPERHAQGSKTCESTLFHAAIIFLGAFLIFQIQPIIGKFILPWFGGTPSVWTMCMLFFQAALFGGYYYAHAITSKCRPATQALIHGSLLFLSAVLILSRTILPGESLKPATDASPALSILLILLITIGLPYFILAATSPLIQFWYSRMNRGRDPYILYSVSNIGSLLALLTYPFLVEPTFPLHGQSRIWSLCFFVFVAGCGVLTVLSATAKQNIVEHDPLRSAISIDRKRRRDKRASDQQAACETRTSGTGGNIGANGEATPGSFQRVCWFVLPMTASTLLLACTNQLCTDVTSGPFLWILPLSIYLMTFILTFTGWRFVYSRIFFFVAMMIGCLWICHVLRNSTSVPFLRQIAAYCAVLYCGCTAMHGELYRLRPRPERLTGYYLSISAGGAAGGVFVGLLAPILFNNFYELHCALIAIPILLIVCGYHGTAGQLTEIRRKIGFVVAALSVLVVAAAFSWQVHSALKNTCDIRRGFFGVVRVEEKFRDVPRLHQYRLTNGNISHGFQFLNPAYRRDLTAYFARSSGVGLALQEYPRKAGLRVGAVGLGIGTISAYARRGDEYRFYETNPDVIAIAQDVRYFDYISEARRNGATIDIVPGDARLSMEREEKTGQGVKFDVLVLDAFNSDSIPMHLLTKEAFALYFRLLKTDGVVAVHVTNRHIDLSPVVLAVAQHYEQHIFFISNEAELEKGIQWSRWILLSNNPKLVKKFYSGRIPVPAGKRMKRPWSDDFCDLWSIMKEQSLLKIRLPWL